MSEQPFDPQQYANRQLSAEEESTIMAGIHKKDADIIKRLGELAEDETVDPDIATRNRQYLQRAKADAQRDANDTAQHFNKKVSGRLNEHIDTAKEMMRADFASRKPAQQPLSTKSNTETELVQDEDKDKARVMAHAANIDMQDALSHKADAEKYEHEAEIYGRIAASQHARLPRDMIRPATAGEAAMLARNRKESAELSRYKESRARGYAEGRAETIGLEHDLDPAAAQTMLKDMQDRDLEARSTPGEQFEAGSEISKELMDQSSPSGTPSEATLKSRSGRISPNY